MREKPKVGQVLYSLNVGNAARNRPQVLTPVIVKSVGKKYFVCGEPDYKYTDTQFHLETWAEKSDYSANSVLYESEDEFLKERRRREIEERLQKCFGPFGKHDLSLDDLEKIISIVDARAKVAA